MILLLGISFCLSFVAAEGILVYLTNHPDSRLKTLVAIFGRMLNSKRTYSGRPAEYYFGKGLFFLPFSFLSLASFMIYFRVQAALSGKGKARRGGRELRAK